MQNFPPLTLPETRFCGAHLATVDVVGELDDLSEEVLNQLLVVHRVRCMGVGLLGAEAYSNCSRGSSQTVYSASASLVEPPAWSLKDLANRVLPQTRRRIQERLVAKPMMLRFQLGSKPGSNAMRSIVYTCLVLQ